MIFFNLDGDEVLRHGCDPLRRRSSPCGPHHRRRGHGLHLPDDAGFCLVQIIMDGWPWAKVVVEHN